MALRAQLRLDSSGSIAKQRSQSPKTIEAWSRARESLARTIIGGVILGFLTIAYIFALFLHIDSANNILVLLGSGLGVLLGGRDRGSQNGP